jgi:DNA-binding transcriptional regulator YbjK
MNPADLRTHLTMLTAERLDAAELGLAGNTIYMAELDEEIAEATHAYTLAAVTELATLRSQLTGAEVG